MPGTGTASCHQKSNQKKQVYTCPYGSCKLHAKSRAYIFQVGYLLTASIYMQCDVKNYNLLSIALFVIPIFIDLWDNISKNKFWKIVHGLFLVMSIVLIFFGIFYELHFLIYNAETAVFSVSSASDVLSKFKFPKSFISHIAVTLSFYPLILHFGAPNLLDAELLNNVVLHK